MEFQIGQKVRIRPKYENNGNRGKIYKVLKIFEKKLLGKWQNRQAYLAKDRVDIISVHIELERLEAAFYEYYEELYCDIPTDDSKIEQKVNELMNVVKSVSINE